MPRPAWNSSKCCSPLSAPRRMRNAHFSPISSIAWGSGQRRAAALYEAHRIEIGEEALSPRLLELNADLLDARAVAGGLEFDYRSSSRAVLSVPSEPSALNQARSVMR